MPSSNCVGRLLSILALLVLAGCGDLPRPFQPEEKYLPIVRPVSPQAAELLRERNSVVIQDVANAPGPGGARLAAAMAVALRDQGVAADVVASGNGFTLAGIADIRPFPNDIEVRITWYVLDDRGLRVGQQEQVTRGRLEDWQDGNDRLLSRIALQGAPQLARLFNTLAAGAPAQPPATAPDQPRPGAAPAVSAGVPPSAGTGTTPAAKAGAPAAGNVAATAPAKPPLPAAPPPPPSSTPLGFSVAKVGGAPGDGNDSLTAGMRLALGRRGFTLFAKPDNNTFVISGAVTLAPFDAEREKITIVWTVFDPSHKKMGDIEQSNVIPKGSLNGAWGGVAKEITVAAAEGLLNLLGRVYSQSKQ